MADGSRSPKKAASDKEKDKPKDTKQEKIRDPPPKEEWEPLETSIIKGPVVLTEEQQQKLNTFKEAVKDIKRPYHDDGELCRWLVAREWDLDKATFMFTESMKWRDKEHIDTVLDYLPKTSDFFDILKEYWPHSILSTHRFYTKDGWPVIYERFGKLDLDMVDMMPLQDLILFHMYTIECVEAERRRCAALHGSTLACTLIQDLEGLGLDHIGPNGVKIFKTIAKIDQDNFPEGLRKVFFVNTPKIFQMGWKLVRGSLDDGVVAKFAFFGDKDEYLPELRKVMTDENIPTEYGGKADVMLTPGGSVKKYKKIAKELRQSSKNKAKDKEREKEQEKEQEKEKEKEKDKEKQKD